MSPHYLVARIAILGVGLVAWAGAAMKNPGFVRLLRRGAEWAATGAVSPVSTPPQP